MSLLAIILQGCAAYKSVHYGEEYSSPTHIENVKVLTYKPQGNFIKLGEVSVFGVTSSNRIYMLNQLKEMAADMGGDAVIIEERDFPRYTPKPIIGVVIKWQDEAVY